MLYLSLTSVCCTLCNIGAEGCFRKRVITSPLGDTLHSLSVCFITVTSQAWALVYTRMQANATPQAYWQQMRNVMHIHFTKVEEIRPLLWSSGQSTWLHNGDAMCFLWGTNWIYICYAEESRPPLWSSGQGSWQHNGDAMCFLWGTNWIYICYVEESRSPLWSSGQSSWLQIQRSGFDSRRYHISWEVVVLERGPLSLVSTIEELL
jgi:hypothetical protein